MNDIAIVMGIGIDKVGDEYLLSTQIVNPSQVAQRGSGGMPMSSVTTYSTKGKSLLEGIRRLTKLTPRKLYFAHIRVLAIDEHLAKDGLQDVLDFFMRQQEIRTDFYVIITKNVNAFNVMSIYDPLEKIPASRLQKGLETSENNWAPTVSIALDELLSDLISEGKEPVLTGLEIKGDIKAGNSQDNINRVKSKALLRYNAIGVLKNDKLIGWLTEAESKGYAYVTNRVDSTVEELPCNKNGYVMIDIIRNDTNVKGRVTKGHPEVEVVIRAEANIGEVDCKIDLSDTKSIYELESKAERQIKERIEKLVKRVQHQYKSDIFGFGSAIHRSAPKEWNTLKHNWDREFPLTQVRIKADVRIRRTGKVGNSFIQNLEQR